MTTMTLKEGTLNDDTLYLVDEGKVFSGNLVAIVEFYTYQNEWCNRKHRKGFKTVESLDKFISKNYASFDLDRIIEY